MPIFDFGKKQRLHTQLIGNTSGKEMFKVDEYNQQNKKIGGVVVFDFIIFTILYFYGGLIPIKFLIFMIILTMGLNYFGYSAYKNKQELKGKLYD